MDIRFAIFGLLMFVNSLFAGEHEALKAQDISKVMGQIFAQHVDKKEMSTAILKHSFKVYIDQFDPDRIYLLADEVNPYLNMPSTELNRIMQQYKNNDFSAYEKLNAIIQQAIERSRSLRADIIQNPTKAIKTASDNGNQAVTEADWLDPDLKRLFPKNTSELQKRIEFDILAFIQAERNRYGKTLATTDVNTLVSFFDRRLRAQENQYLFEDSSGERMAVADKENVFVIHVLKALASSLDSHTTFFNNTEAFDMKVRLEKGFQGIGIVLASSTSGPVVSRLIAGSPAEKSGLIKPNDRLTAINDKSISHESFEKITELMNGAAGSQIKVTVVRKVEGAGKTQDKVIDVNLTREAIVLQEDRAESSYEKFGNGIIGKIKLDSFYQSPDGISSEKDVKAAIEKLQRQGDLRGLVLDLRENSGGFLMQAVKVAGLFITNGVIVVSKYSSGDEKFYRDMDGQTFYRGPLVVLTSKATASAAEIVAQALQDYGVALVVGDEHTYGKGTIQSQTVTNNKGNSSYFKVTVGKYYTVSGKTPQIQGVKADIVVPGQFSNEHLGEEYLSYAMKADLISPSFNDALQDVNPELKSWYLHYYMPSLQHQTDYWKKWLPTLKRNSANRLTQNKEYQDFLNPSPELRHTHALMRGSSSMDDLQLNEAINIVKDMSAFQAQDGQKMVTAKNS